MTYADINSYLERIGVAHRSIAASYCGDYDRIYDVVNNPDTYKLPALWIESPEMTPVGTDNSIREQWAVSIVVLHKGNNQNTDQNKYEIEMSYRTARELLYRMLRDENEGYLRTSIINKSISPIDPYSSHYLVGWRINLTFQTKAEGPCYDIARWDESVGVTDELSFVIYKEDTDIIADNVILPTSIGWTWTWTHQVNNGAAQDTPYIGPLSINDAAADRIYIVLRGVHTSGVQRVCSAFYQPGISSIRSVPYLYNLYNQS